RARRPERAGCPRARAARRVARLLPAADRRGVRVLRAGDASHLAQAAAPGRRAPERAARVGGARHRGSSAAMTGHPVVLWKDPKALRLGGLAKSIVEANEVSTRGLSVGPQECCRELDRFR